MATFNYEEMSNTALELLEYFGNEFTLIKPSKKSVYNPVTKKNENIKEEHKGIGVMKTYTAEMIGSLANIINAGDVAFVCKLDDESIIPSEGKDQIKFGNYIYNVLEVATSNPSGDKILVHTLQCRKAV